MEESLILSKFDGLVESGDVLYNEKQEIIEYVDGDLKFQFVVTSALAEKPVINTSQSKVEEKSRPRDGSDINTSGFEIGDVGDNHILIVNKFSFARPHVMLLTSDGHQRQFEPLQQDDLEAAWAILSAMTKSYVAFYNCGQVAGCSRLHKHLQLIPTPRDSFAAFLDVKDGKEPSIPFQWFYHRFGGHVTPSELTQVYSNLLKQAAAVGKDCSEHNENLPPGAACPHNMILTNRWMVVLPRQQAAINKEGGVNAIGMLGYIAITTKKEMDNWIRLGPLNALRQLGVPKLRDGNTGTT